VLGAWPAGQSSYPQTVLFLVIGKKPYLDYSTVEAVAKPVPSPQFLNADIPKLKAGAMAEKTDMTRFPFEAWMRPAVHGFGDLAYISINNNATVKFDPNLSSLSHNFL